MDYLNSFTDQLSTSFGGAFPNVLGALLVLIIGLFLAKIIKKMVVAALKKTQIDEQIAAKMNFSFSLGNFLAKMIYYLCVMFVLLMVLSMMGIDSVLDPLKNMLDKFLEFIPNIIAAGIIGFVGYIIAKLVSEAVAMVSSGLEQYSNKLGFNNPLQLTGFLKQIVFIIIFFPILIQALAALQMEAISGPATAMLSQLMSAIPSIIAAAIILAVFFFVGRYVVSILKGLLTSLGLNEFAAKAGLQSMLGNTNLADLIGNVIFFFLMFTGVIAAVGKLEMTSISNILTEVMEISGQVFFGLIILMAGAFIANIAAKAVSESSSGKWMVPVIRFAVIGIFLAFALHTMGIAESIVNLAFGLTLGALAVAFALAFGLGGREAAGKQMESFFKKIRDNK